MEELKGTRLRVLDMIRDFIATKGYPPTVRDIVRVLSLSSNSVAVYHLTQLSQKGYIQRSPKIARSIRILREAK